MTKKSNDQAKSRFFNYFNIFLFSVGLILILYLLFDPSVKVFTTAINYINMLIVAFVILIALSYLLVKKISISVKDGIFFIIGIIVINFAYLISRLILDAGRMLK
jgi:hypothetical protein